MYVLVAHQSAPCDCFDNALTPPFKSMSYLRYLFTILLTLTMFYGWASPSVATSQFVCRGVGLTEPERSSLWNLSDVSTLDKAGLNLAPRYVAASVHDGDSVHTIISEIIDGRRMRYLVDGSNLIWIGEETPEMHIMVDTLCYTSALLPFGDCVDTAVAVLSFKRHPHRRRPRPVRHLLSIRRAPPRPGRFRHHRHCGTGTTDGKCHILQSLPLRRQRVRPPRRSARIHLRRPHVRSL